MFQHTREQGTFSCCPDHLSCRAHFFEYPAERQATSVVLKNEADGAAEDYSTLQISVTGCSSDPTTITCRPHAVVTRLEGTHIRRVGRSGKELQVACLLACLTTTFETEAWCQ
jgi:hypothetical protein